MTFCTDDGKTACGLNFLWKLDIGTTTCHVCCNGHSRSLTGMLYDLCLTCVLLSIEDLVLDATKTEHTAEEL